VIPVLPRAVLGLLVANNIALVANFIIVHIHPSLFLFLPKPIISSWPMRAFPAPGSLPRARAWYIQLCVEFSVSNIDVSGSGAVSGSGRMEEERTGCVVRDRVFGHLWFYARSCRRLSAKHAYESNSRVNDYRAGSRLYHLSSESLDAPVFQRH
jgi:hypothetical protein